MTKNDAVKNIILDIRLANDKFQNDDNFKDVFVKRKIKYFSDYLISVIKTNYIDDKDYYSKRKKNK